MQANRYPWESRMQLPIGHSWYHCCWQLGTWCWFHEYMNPHTVPFDTGIGMHTDCAKPWYSDLLCGADWTFYAIKTEIPHLHRVTPTGWMTYLFLHTYFTWVCMGELEWSGHDRPKVSLSLHCCHFLDLSLCYYAKGLVYDIGANHDWNCLRVGLGWYNKQQHILIIMLDPWDLEVDLHKAKVRDGCAPCPL